MQSYSIYKVPQGKLLKISLEYDEKMNVITDICITGDFFAYPEEAIELLEKKLKNTMLDHVHLLEKISSLIAEYHIQFIGVNAEGLTQGILMCRP
ncbi:MAG TPA: lipoate protein ligase C-terminal domain-containing protein [Candidatus Thermoplasmatota archaeon]|nr:lipoate protein ligase C-terminal domain-containing protein [Candidatus Thermoplasmatota archaeon]